jgi:Mannosylglycerate hydrolase MGH1-like glycoside hydrolase domain
MHGQSEGPLRREARRVLEHNWRAGVARDGTAFAYTAPDAAKFPAQFYWDSCFHAIAWAALDPRRARAELRSLLAAQEPDGFIGHTVFWDRRVRLSRRPFYNLLSPRDRMTRTIQPPLLGLAWEIVADASADDPGFRTEGLDRLTAHFEWLRRHRDPSGTGLLAIIQPDESGLDASPKFDARLGWRAHGLPGFVALVRRNRRDRFGLERVRSRDGFVVREVLTNVCYALSLDAIARLTGSRAFAQRAERTRQALLDRSWDRRRGLFLDTPQRAGAGVSTWSALSPIALAELPPEVARRLVDEHLLDPARYWRRYPVPSTAANERAYRPRTTFPFRYWRGPTWIAASWLIHRGLVAHGRHQTAEELAARVRSLVSMEGFREYYHPDTGRGQGARRFGMSTLAVALG